MTTPTMNESVKPVAASSRRARLQRVLEIAVSLAFLILAVRGIQLDVLWAALRQANYIWLVPAVLATVATMAIKAWRWQLLFRPEYHPAYGSVFTALAGGYLASNVLPARLGEVISIVLLVSDQPVSTARTLSTLIVTRLLDVLTMLVILVALLPFIQLPPDMTKATLILGVVALLGAGLIVLLSFWKERLLSLAHAMLKYVRPLDRPGVYAALGHLIDGFATLRGRMGIALVGISLLSWAGVVTAAWCSAQAARLDVPLTAVIFASMVVALGMLVPSSPGYIGVFHYLVTVALAPFGVLKVAALGYGIIWHGMNYLTLSITGMVALWVHGTSLGQVLERWRNPDRVTGDG
ncbi:MAG: flippase-like domain-containing protein [Anaerolineae bacterium]|nr:flippase-like domain-containing protein [Anaerolineae bacterium]